jgi:hypothetical protein
MSSSSLLGKSHIALQETAQDDGDAFGNAFENVELSEAARARGQEIEQEVNAKLLIKIQEQRAKWNRVGDAVGHDGDVLFVRGTDEEAPIPGTEAHRIWLTRHVDSLLTQCCCYSRLDLIVITTAFIVILDALMPSIFSELASVILTSTLVSDL